MFLYNVKPFFCIYVYTAATGDMPAYQIRTPTTALPQGVVMAASPGTLHSPQQLAEEATRKRELRLMKNRYGYLTVTQWLVIAGKSKVLK